MPSFFHVYELELDEPRSGGRGGKEVEVAAPIRLKTTDLGCFVAETEGDACRDAARSVGRAGDFIAIDYGDKLRKIALGGDGYKTAVSLKEKVVDQRKKALDEADSNSGSK